MFNNLFSNLTPVVKNLIILNVVVFIGTGWVAPALYDSLVLYFFKDPEFQIWQIFSHMFMHSKYGLTHIFFNMYGLILFGPIIERRWGSNRFLFFYLSAGLGAVALTYGFQYFEYMDYVNEGLSRGYTVEQVEQGIFTRQEPYGWKVMSGMVGASGCLFGVLAAFAFLYPNIELMILFIPIPIKAKYLIGIYVIYETLSAFGFITLQQNVGHAAHLGGAIVGFIIAWYWKRNDMNQYRID